MEIGINWHHWKQNLSHHLVIQVTQGSAVALAVGVEAQ